MPVSDREVSEPPAKRRKGDGNFAIPSFALVRIPTLCL